LVVKPRAPEIKFAPENILLLPNNSLASTTMQQRAGLHRSLPPADSSPMLTREDTKTAVLGFSSDKVVAPFLDVPLVGLLDDGDNSDDDVALSSVPSTSVTSTSASAPVYASESVSARANDSLPSTSLTSSVGEGNTDSDHVQLQQSSAAELSLNPLPRRTGRNRKRTDFYINSNLVFSPENPSDGYDLRDAEFQLWVGRVHEKCGSSEMTRYKLSWVPDWVWIKLFKRK
jgi:hypothetical protein